MGLAIGDIVQGMFVYSHFGQTLRNIVHFKVTEGAVGSTQTQVQEIADWLGDQGDPTSPGKSIVGVLPSTCTMEYTRAQLVSPTRFSYRQSVVAQAGELDESTTANIDAVITKQIDLALPKAVFNFYLPGLAAETFHDGVLSTGFKAVLVDAFQWLLVEKTLTISGVKIRPVIWHQFTGGGTSDITNITVQPQVRVMTRRTVGHGE